MSVNSRAPQTLNHPHGYLQPSGDGKVGLVRISKNASTELAARLDCKAWIPFEDFGGPTVAFLRSPLERVLSSIPETLLRIAHPKIQELHRPELVLAPKEIYDEVCLLARRPIETFLSGYVELLGYGFFDAHHEPQISFLTNRHGIPAVDPYLYLTADLEPALRDIGNRFGARLAGKGPTRLNSSGAKPSRGRGPIIDALTRVTRTGVYKRTAIGGPLAARYDGSRSLSTWQIRDLNILSNRFAAELRHTAPSASVRAAVAAMYEADDQLWNVVRNADCPGQLSAFLA